MLTALARHAPTGEAACDHCLRPRVAPCQPLGVRGRVVSTNPHQHGRAVHRRGRDSPQVPRQHICQARNAARTGDAAGRRDALTRRPSVPPAVATRARRPTRRPSRRASPCSTTTPPRRVQEPLTRNGRSTAEPWAGRPSIQVEISVPPLSIELATPGYGPDAADSPAKPRTGLRSTPGSAVTRRSGPCVAWASDSQVVLETGVISNIAVPSATAATAAAAKIRRRNAWPAIHPKSMPLCVGVMVGEGMCAGASRQPRAPHNGCRMLCTCEK